MNSSGTIELFEDSAICVNPTLGYKNNVVTPWLEDFEISSIVTLTKTNISDENVTIVEDANSFDGKSALLRLPEEDFLFECYSTSGFDLPTAGANVLLEFNYKCNHPFVISVLSENPQGDLQTPLFSVSASEEWNYVYVSLTSVVSTNFTASEHRPVFGFVRNEGFDEEIEVYLDNIRLIHFEP